MQYGLHGYKRSRMKRSKIWQEIELELRKAKKAFPNWPDHVAAQAGIVCEEAGELMQASLELKYEKGKKGQTIEQQQQQVRAEAIQTAAMAIRFLENFKTTSNDECKIITETRTDS